MRALDGLAAAATVGLVALVALGLTGPPRLVLALVFVTFVPGWAALGHSGITTGVSRIALAVAASLTICTATALAMAWLQAWHPLPLFYGLAGGSATVLFGQSVRRPARIAVPAAATAAPIAAPAVTEPEPLPPPRRVVERAEPERTTTGQPANPRVTLLAVHVSFPPRSPFAAGELVDLFAAVHERYGFTDFHRDADAGAVMEAAGAYRLEVRRDGVDYTETAPDDLDAAAQRAVELLGDVEHRLGVVIGADPSCRLHATWDTGGAALARAAGLDTGRLGLLSGDGAVGVALHLVDHADRGHHDWRLTIEPDVATDRVSVELVTDFADVGGGTGAVGAHLVKANAFLTDEVTAFVESLLRRGAGEP